MAILTKGRYFWYSGLLCSLIGFLIALSGGPLTSQFHLQVVQPMGGSQLGKPRGDARYFKDDGQQRTRDRETVER